MNAQRKHAVSEPAHVDQDRLTEAVRTTTANPRPANDPRSYLSAPPENYVQARCVNPDGSTNHRDVALYAIGCEQGKAAAYQYLERHNRAGEHDMGRLHYLVLDMLDAPRDSLLRGQVVGFFHTLEKAALA